MIHWLVETMIATSLLLIAVLALRGPVTRYFGPRAAYLLWAAPALRMILPPLPSGWSPFATPEFRDVVVVLAGTSSLPVQTTAAAGGGAVWPLVLLGLWLGGAALFFVQHLASYWAFTRDIRNDAEPMFAQGRIRVARSSAVMSPIAFGIFGKTIIVPADFAHRFDETEQRLALSHETFHHHRGDLIVNMAALAILALHWFNPLAHFAHRLFRLDQEAACDDLVLANTSASERKAYGVALYKSATGAVPLIACAMGTASQLKARLQCIIAQPKRSGAASGMALMAGLVLAGLATTASGHSEPTAPAQPVKRVVALSDDVIVAGNPAPSARVRQANSPNASSPHGGVKQHTQITIVRTRDVRIADAAPPVPPAPPAPPAAATPPAPPAPPAPPKAMTAAAAARLANVNCVNTGKQTVFFHRANISNGTERGFTLIMCDSGGQIAPDRVHMLVALESARATLANASLLSDAQRTHALAAIEREIATLRSKLDAQFAVPAT